MIELLFSLAQQCRNEALIGALIGGMLVALLQSVFIYVAMRPGRCHANTK